MTPRCDCAIRASSPPPGGAVLVLRRGSVVDEATGWSSALSPDVVHWLDARQRAGETWAPAAHLGAGLIGLVHLEWTDQDDPAPVVPMRGVPLFKRRTGKLDHERLFDRGRDLQVVALGAGHYAVASHSEPGRWHRVIIEERGGYLATLCSCRSSRYRPRHRSLACSHAAAVFEHVAQAASAAGGCGIETEGTPVP